MNFYELIQMVGQNTLIYGGSLVVVLSVLVFVHEWGHYIVARMCGIRVEKFSIGFGKEIYGFTDKNFPEILRPFFDFFTACKNKAVPMCFKQRGKKENQVF